MLATSSKLVMLQLPPGRLAAQDSQRMSVICLAFILRSIAEVGLPLQSEPVQDRPLFMCTCLHREHNSLLAKLHQICNSPNMLSVGKKF